MATIYSRPPCDNGNIETTLIIGCIWEQLVIYDITRAPRIRSLEPPKSYLLAIPWRVLRYDRQDHPLPEVSLHIYGAKGPCHHVTAIQMAIQLPSHPNSNKLSQLFCTWYTDMDYAKRCNDMITGNCFKAKHIFIEFELRTKNLRWICNQGAVENRMNSLLVSPRIADSIFTWGQVTHIYIDNLTTIGSDNGLSRGQCKTITGIQIFSLKKMHLKMSSAKWGPLFLGFNQAEAWWRIYTSVTWVIIGSSNDLWPVQHTNQLPEPIVTYEILCTILNYVIWATKTYLLIVKNSLPKHILFCRHFFQCLLLVVLHS